MKEEKYLASDGTWKDVYSYTEKIKVRFGSDVTVEVKSTDNGVLLPKNLLEGEARQLAFNLIPEAWE